MQLCGSLNILWHCLCDWNDNWLFPVLWPVLSFPNLLAYWVQDFHSIVFSIWNSSTGIPSPPLALFVVMLPKVHLTSHSRMSGSRWVITPSWSGSGWVTTLSLLLYLFSICTCHRGHLCNRIWVETAGILSNDILLPIFFRNRTSAGAWLPRRNTAFPRLPGSKAGPLDYILGSETSRVWWKL